MLLLITESTISDEKSKEFLDNILLSHRFGKHIVVLENRLMTKKMLSMYKNDEPSMRTIYNLHDTFGESHAFLDTVNTYVKINSLNSEFSKSIDSSGKLLIELPVNYFDDQISSCNLLSENDLDIDFYRSIMEKIQEEKSLGFPINIKFSIEALPGGGSTLPGVFDSKVMYEKKITYSICDSDIEEENQEYEKSTVANQITIRQNNMDNRGPNISNYYILGVREKENLIPPSYYLKHSFFKYHRALNILSKLEGTENEELLKYVKLSSGRVKLTSKIEKLIALSDKEKKGIDKKALHIFSCATLFNDEFIEKKDLVELNSLGKIEESDPIINGRFFEELPSYLKEEYQKLMINMISWTCAYDRVRT